MVGIVNQAVERQGPQDAKNRKLAPDVQKMVTAAKLLVTAPQVVQKLVQMMKAAGDPARGIALATVFIINQLVEKSKGTVPPKAVLPAAHEILAIVAKVGVAARLFEFKPELIQQAATLVAQMFREMAQPQPAQEQVQEQAAPTQPVAPAAAAAPAAAPMGV